MSDSFFGIPLAMQTKATSKNHDHDGNNKNRKTSDDLHISESGCETEYEYIHLTFSRQFGSFAPSTYAYVQGFEFRVSTFYLPSTVSYCYHNRKIVAWGERKQFMLRNVVLDCTASQSHRRRQCFAKLSLQNSFKE